MRGLTCLLQRGTIEGTWGLWAKGAHPDMDTPKHPGSQPQSLSPSISQYPLRSHSPAAPY